MRTRGAVIALGVAVAAVGAVWLYRSTNNATPLDEQEVLTIERVDYPLLVTAAGSLDAPRSVAVGPPTIRNEYRYKLARIVDEGKYVSEGDFLMEFDGSDVSRRLRQETSNFQRVQEEYQKKRSDFDIRIRELRLQLDQAQADLEKLETKLDQQVELESAIAIEETRIRLSAARKRVAFMTQKIEHATKGGRLDLQISRSNEKHYKDRMDALLDAMDDLTVTAPVSGVVIYKRDWNNEPKQVGSNVYLLETVLDIPDLSMLQVRVYVDEVDVSKIHVGQEARVIVDAVKGRVFAGKVAATGAILKQVQYDIAQKVAENLIELEGANVEMLRPGMNARVQIKVGSYPDAIVVPFSSIEEREGRSFVQVWNATKDRFDWREIQIMRHDGQSAVVSEGLAVQERIRLAPREV